MDADIIQVFAKEIFIWDEYYIPDAPNTCTYFAKYVKSFQVPICYIDWTLNKVDKGR